MTMRLPLAVLSLAAALTGGLVAPASASPAGHHPSAPKLEMGFFEQWSIYGRGYSLAQADQEGEIAGLTDLMYAFGGVLPAQGAASTPDPVGNPVTCQSVDSWADYGTPYLPDVAGGNPVGPDGLAGNFQQLRELKAKYPQLRVILSLGGYSGSGFFSDAASTARSRAEFVSSCIDEFVRGNLPGLPAGAAAGIFDGFDLDWEYPGNDNGAPGNHYSPADVRNYPLLAQEFRRQLSAVPGRHRLTAEMPVGAQNTKDIDVAAMARPVDQLVLMDYDLQGPWNPQGPTNFESNLFSSPLAPDSTAEPRISVDSSVRYFERHGAPAGKLVVGIPYYGHGWTGVPAGRDYGLYQPATGPAGSPDLTRTGTVLAGLDGTDPSGTTDYYELAQQPNLSWHTDPITRASWAYDAASRTFWSMQTPQEVTEKARYIDQRGLAGASMWDLSGDWQNQLTGALTRTLNPRH